MNKVNIFRGQMSQTFIFYPIWFLHFFWGGGIPWLWFNKSKTDKVKTWTISNGINLTLHVVQNDMVLTEKPKPASAFLSVSWRILGSLISAHILLTDPKHPFGKVGFEGYNNELLHLAHDLAVRLLPAFENTSTGIPYPRVSHALMGHRWILQGNG